VNSAVKVTSQEQPKAIKAVVPETLFHVPSNIPTMSCNKLGTKKEYKPHVRTKEGITEFGTSFPSMSALSKMTVKENAKRPTGEVLQA
jgi:hypothetical protein